MLTLHQFEISPFCDKIRRILHVKRQPYVVKEVPLTRARSIRRLNPTGKLPCIEHEGQRIGDSTEIAYYLEERFPDPPLVPADPAERARVHVLEDWADESLYFYEMRLRFTLPRNARRWFPVLAHQDPSWFQRVVGLVGPRLFGTVLKHQGVGRKSEALVLREVERHFDALEAWLSRARWLVGDGLTLADIAVFAQCFCITGSEEGAKLAASRPALSSWMERVDRATGQAVAARASEGA